MHSIYGLYTKLSTVLQKNFRKILVLCETAKKNTCSIQNLKFLETL